MKTPQPSSSLHPNIADSETKIPSSRRFKQKFRHREERSDVAIQQQVMNQALHPVKPPTGLPRFARNDGLSSRTTNQKFRHHQERNKNSFNARIQTKIPSSRGAKRRGDPTASNEPSTSPIQTANCIATLRSQ
jgi:hypothetical protein